LSPGAFALSANIVVVIHVAFVVFVLLGGLLVLRWPRLAWLHVPAAVWGILIEYANWICPLTPLENYLRERAGLASYTGDFIDNYVLPLLYPARLTRSVQLLLGTVALAVNGIVYWRVIVRATHAHRSGN
jgi:Protein of Unknown function (DUF2784)